MTAVVARNLEKRFGRTIGLDGIDLDIPAGSTTAILGPNGAGKSTLLRLIAGLARPSSGSLEVGGQPAHSRAARARVGFIGHATGLYPELTARENLIFAARLRGVADATEKIEAQLKEAGLTRAADRRTGEFSRGMAQRLSIAVGLIDEPEIVLLDEPFTGLDGTASNRLAERLMGLRQRNRTLVLVSHDVALAARLADAAVVLRRGRIAHRESGDPLDAKILENAYSAASNPEVS
ncbi:MAG: ABC transporter ATP-binding protein [Deltaproteobacteria bacterium]|nr:ABC transporter ATP-binding protein [Deltaproteobacteria bacterium]